VFFDLVDKHQGAFHDAEYFKKSKIIDILQEMIERGMKIEVESIKGKWCEIDTIQDLEIAKKIFAN
jgi:NDP-sugar pyrophosphorylase family protein